MMSEEQGSLRVRIPMEFKKRGGRKLVILPENAGMTETSVRRPDLALINGLSKAHRWQVIYERERHASLAVFAEKHKLNMSYAARVMRLNLLAPDIRMAIMDGGQPRTLQLADLMKPFPTLWAEQRKIFGFDTDRSLLPSVSNPAYMQ